MRRFGRYDEDDFERDPTLAYAAWGDGLIDDDELEEYMEGWEEEFDDGDGWNQEWD